MALQNVGARLPLILVLRFGAVFGPVSHGILCDAMRRMSKPRGLSCVGSEGWILGQWPNPDAMRGCASGVALLCLAFCGSTACAETQQSGIGLGFAIMQKVWQGVTENPRMTTCRLARRYAYKKKQICVYSGANHTLLAIYNDAGAFCSNEVACKYEPDRSKSIVGFVQAFKSAQDK